MRTIFFSILIFILSKTEASFILIPMDENSQTNHLKAYGIVYSVLEKNEKAKWYLNYRGGSFLINDNEENVKKCIVKNVSYEILSNEKVNVIEKNISSPSVNQEVVILEKCPKIAVYSPKDKMPWDDAVMLGLSYAEIPYDIIYDDEILNGNLIKYDWLHLHHEDFTGQYGKFYSSHKDSPWYIISKKNMEESARKHGYSKVSQYKLAVAKTIKDFVIGGGFLFAMCSATDSFDIALSAEGIDICESMFDGDPSEPNYQSKIDYSKCLAFHNFILEKNHDIYEYSNIDVSGKRGEIPQQKDLFTLFEFSAKWDVVPTMLCQNHTFVIKNFMGQTSGFNKNTIKPSSIILGENKPLNEAKYIHGTLGKGLWTFYGGHDPEDYAHRVGDPKTELDSYPNSPGYRLILNNILFPASNKKHKKT